jgi:excisionase family DNA binding protein
MQLSDFLTVKQYADKYGLSKYTLYKHIQNGLLEVQRKGTVYLIKDQLPAYSPKGKKGKLQG